MNSDLIISRVENAPELTSFLMQMDREFPHPLSSKCLLSEYAHKLIAGGLVEGAWKEGELLGILAGYANNREKLEAYISVLVVDPKYRGRHISSMLLNAFEVEARDAGMKYSRVFTYRTNSAAFGLYSAHGYKNLGLCENGDYELLKKL